MEKHRFSFIGERLRELRGSQSQGDFAARIGVSFRTYQRYESGATAPKKDVLEKISQATGTPIDWILTGSAYGVTIAESRAAYADPLREAIIKLLDRMAKKEKEEVLRYAEFLEEKKKGRD